MLGAGKSLASQALSRLHGQFTSYVFCIFLSLIWGHHYPDYDPNCHRFGIVRQTTMQVGDPCNPEEHPARGLAWWMRRHDNSIPVGEGCLGEKNGTEHDRRWRTWRPERWRIILNGVFVFSILNFQAGIGSLEPVEALSIWACLLRLFRPSGSSQHFGSNLFMYIHYNYIYIIQQSSLQMQGSCFWGWRGPTCINLCTVLFSLCQNKWQLNSSEATWKLENTCILFISFVTCMIILILILRNQEGCLSGPASFLLIFLQDLWLPMSWGEALLICFELQVTYLCYFSSIIAHKHVAA